jgi:hypothetical protein
MHETVSYPLRAVVQLPDAASCGLILVEIVLKITERIPREKGPHGRFQALTC